MPSIDVETYWCLGKAIRRVLTSDGLWTKLIFAVGILDNAREHIRRTAIQEDIEECPMCKEEENQ